MTRRLRTDRRLLALAVAVVSAALAGGAYAAVQAATGSLPVRQELAAGRPAGAPGQTMELVRVVIPPGGTIAAHSHPGMQIIYIESGSIDYTVIEGSIRVRRAPLADAASGPVELVQAGQTVTIRSGDTFIERRGMVHSVVNTGTEPAVILASSLFARNEPANIPYAG